MNWRDFPPPIMTKEQQEEFNAFMVKSINQVFENDLVEALIEYGNKRYPRIDMERELESTKDGTSFKDFIESLSYKTQE